MAFVLAAIYSSALADYTADYTWSAGRAQWLADGKWVNDQGVAGVPVAGDVCYVDASGVSSGQNYWLNATTDAFNATLILKGANAHLIISSDVTANDLILDGGCLHHGVEKKTFALSGNLLVASDSTIDIDDGNPRTLQIKSTLSGTGNLTVLGSSASNSVLEISNANADAYSGQFLLTKATLKLSESGALENVISGTGALSKTGSGTLTLTGASTYTGGTTIEAGKIVLSGAGTLGTGTVVDNGILEFAHDSAQTFSNVISGTGALSKTGSGTLTLTGASTYAGGTTISNGMLILSGTNASVGTGALDISSDSKLSLAGTRRGLLKVPALTGNGPISVDSTSFLALATNDPQTYSGTISVAENQAIHIGYNDGADRAGNVSLPDATVSLAFTGSNLGLVHESYSAKVTTFEIGTLNGVDGAIVRTSGSNGGSANNSTLIVGKGDFAGVIGGNAGNQAKLVLIKITEGTLTLSGVNVYAGGTTIEAGKIVLSGAGTLGTGDVTNSGTLEFYNSTAASITPNISGDGDILVSAGTANLTGTVNQTGGTTTLADGTTLNIGNASTLYNLAVVDEDSSATLNITGNLTLNNSQLTKFIGSISATTIEKTGLDTLQLCFDAVNAVNIDSLVVSSGRIDLKGYITGGITIKPDSVFSPGNSVGDARFGGGYELKEDAMLLIEQDASGIDTLTATSFDIDSNSIIDFAADSLQPGASYDIIFQTDSEGNPKNFTGAQATDDFWNNLLTPESAYYWNLSVSGNVVRASVDANAVPEPSTWALLLLGAAGLLYVRKRKN